MSESEHTTPEPSEPQAPIAGENATPAGTPRAARAKKEPVVTLVGFLTSRTGAAAFLKNLREANVWTFSTEDREDALARHRDLDGKFTRTAGLLAHALKAKDDRHALPVAEFALGALLDRLRDYPHWIGSSWEELTPDERAHRVAAAVGRKFTDAKKGREARNLLATTLLLLTRESLASETAVRATIRALDAHAESTPRWDRERTLFIAGPRSNLSELRTLVQTILPWIERADRSETSLEEAHAATDAERRGRETAEAEMEERAAAIRELELEVQRLRGRLGAVEEELRSSLVHGSHNLDQTRSSVRALLEGRVGALLASANEALELEPPRPHIAREKVTAARDAIQEQLKWLEP
jgi:hypothetical protein